MKRALIAAALATLSAASAAATTRIVATTADLAALAHVVGGDLVSIETLVPAIDDPEAFEPRPGDLHKLQSADLVARVGLGYDAWLDRLLIAAGNPGLMRGAPGYVDGSVGIPLLDVRSQSITNDAGHSHGAANPHYWLDPQNAGIITGGIAEALIAQVPHERARIIANRDRFIGALMQRLAAWNEQEAAFARAKFIAYHNSWPYFARRFRMNIVDFIELKPGVSAAPAHLARLAAEGRDTQVRAVLHEPWEPVDASRFLANKLGVPIVTLAPSVGSMPGAGDYFALFDFNLTSIEMAIAKPR
jgi:ABC-type Zn uptake system ZnuABC Zn-binding protein ZnuA